MKIIKLMVFVLTFCLLLSLASADDPPSLTGYQQFYGQISNLPNEGYTLKADIGDQTYTTSISADGKYGYAPVFKVYGENGQEITFSAISALGGETVLGIQPYQDDSVTELNMGFPNPDPDTDVDQDNDDDGGTRTRTNNEEESGISNGTCSYNWECTGWSACVNRKQTQTCHRIDVCDTFDGEVIPTLKPLEMKACGRDGRDSGVSIPSGKTCSANSKRCLGYNLQQCSADGSTWNTLQSCSEGCDSITLSCKVKREEADAHKKQTSSWPYFLIGSIILFIVVVIIIIAFFRRKKSTFVEGY